MISFPTHSGRPGPRSRVLAVAAALSGAMLVPVLAWAQGEAAPASAPPVVQVVNDAAGSRLQVGGQDFMVHGMNWDYVPIGQNYAWSLWSQPDEVIVAALDREMPLLRSMGVNAIRQYAGIPPRWVRYIYEHYGIWTVINHTAGRYGFTVGGVWHPSVDYSDPTMRAAIEAEVTALADQFRGCPGVLMILIGNENNYGLTWKSAETEALPKGERDAARAKYLYSMFGELITAVKQHDPGVPVAIANGDLQYIDIIASECKGLDVLGANVYRGISAGDLFQVVHDKLGIPVMFTEFGSDAYNAREMREDQVMQARYLVGQWREIYEQSSGKGQVGNAIGGFVFQWSDGWWKFGQESRLDLHDTNASWPNGGYTEDYVKGENNMNEEWWGICAKGQPDSRGLFDEHPRAAYYALRRAFALPAYAPGTDLAAIRAHFATIDPVVEALATRGDQASLATQVLDKVHLTGARLQFETYSTGGRRLSTRTAESPGAGQPAFRGFDRLESFYADMSVTPAENVTGTLSLNVLGNVPQNPIDEIFYENRGLPVKVLTQGQPVTLYGNERVKVYKSSVSWNDRWFDLDGFYRTGHFHWGYEGDFFGLYREANYGINTDIYNADAPLGVEMTGKRAFQGLKLAFGPQLWWGANPAVMLKYRHAVGPFDATGLYQHDLTSQTVVSNSAVVPVPPTTKTTLDLKTTHGPFGVELGGIWSGANKAGQVFQVEDTNVDPVLQDHVLRSDAFGAKGKLTFERGSLHWYAQSAAMGLVADGGPTAALTYTGWNLKDSGSGNQTNFLTGLAWNVGKFQFAPNYLWQKPIVGPMPNDPLAPGRKRNILIDPFAVRANRETEGAEMLITFDPTPASFLWAWDNDVREDARLAGSLDFVYRHLPTTQDAAVGVFKYPDGTQAVAAFPGATPARDLWELSTRLVSRVSAGTRVIAHAYVGTNEPNGQDARLVHRFGGDARLGWKSVSVTGFVKVNDWGPYDYHKDFNLTYPLQLMGDLSFNLGPVQWLDHQQSRIGVRATWRSLDQYSPRFVADPNQTLATTPNGSEWEFRTYVDLVR